MILLIVGDGMTNKCIFLDRDGIINECEVIEGKPHPPQDLLHTNLVCGIREVLVSLQKMGYLLIIISNQPDVANKLIAKEKVEEINNFILDALPIDDMYVCYHNKESNCNCRKPKIGLLLDAQKKYNIDFSKSYFIGDRKCDIEAGKSARCKTIFVDYNYKEENPLYPDFTIYNVNDMKEIIYNAN